MTQGQLNHDNQKISALLEVFLQHYQSKENAAANQSHLDEDSLSAFVEGNLTKREAEPVLLHLVGCSPCRKITAQLARLAEEISEAAEIITAVETAQPNRLQQFLHSLGLSGFGFSDDAVFAHQDSTDESKNKSEDKTDNAENTNGNQSEIETEK